MTVTIEYLEVCTRVQAATALAGIMPQTRTALFHPDHDRAMILVVRDVAAMIVASFPDNLVRGASFGDESAEIEFDIEEQKLEIVRSALFSAITSLTLAQLKIAASDRPEQVISLTRSITEITSSLASYAQSSFSPSRIKPALNPSKLPFLIR